MKAIRTLISVLCLGLASQALACPGCKDALSSGSSVTNPWSSAYNISILFMLGVVLAFVSGMGYFVFRLARSEAKLHAGEQPAAPRRWSLLSLPAFAVVYIAIFAWVDAHEAVPVAKVDIPALVDGTFRSASLMHPKMLVEFNASWCAACKTTEPEFGKFLQSAPADMKCFAIDTDKSPVTTKEFSVDTLPCMMLICDGKEVARRAGVITEGELKDWVLKNSPKQ